MYLYEHGMNGWGYTLMVFMGLALWALVAVAVLGLFRRTGSTPVAGACSAERLLAERFARGEIDDDEYYRRLAVLHHDDGWRPEAGERS